MTLLAIAYLVVRAFLPALWQAGRWMAGHG